MSYYTANVKLYENSSGAIGTTGNVLAFNPNDVVPDATVTANSLLTGGLVTLQTGGGAPVPTFPVTVVGTPANGQVPVWNNTNHDWEPGAGSGTSGSGFAVAGSTDGSYMHLDYTPSQWGISATTGVPYFNDANVTAGDEAVYTVGSDGSLALVQF